jgi:hypothetical protein
VKHANIVGVKWVSDRQMATIVDQRSRDVLKISGKRFMRNRADGKYAALDADACPGIVELALIAPEPRAKLKGARGARKKRTRSR